jgi:hypothetical protein
MEKEDYGVKVLNELILKIENMSEEELNQLVEESNRKLAINSTPTRNNPFYDEYLKVKDSK